MVTVKTALPNGLAYRAGVRDGDILLTINGQEIKDVLDYRFYLTEKKVSLNLLQSGKEYRITIRKDEYDDIGLEFGTPLMDQKHACRNKCVFCFIDQLPAGMRKTLYFKDDDDRLSFLHGNYVTLTNLDDRDVERLIKMHISPINVSVHTTNPELRVRMMKNKRAGEVLSYLKGFADAGLTLCTQIVLCKGWNDGEELDRTMHDLTAYYPSLLSCAIVPVGLTKFREGLPSLEPFTKEDAESVISQVNRFGDECLAKYGSRIFFCADEFYLKAERPIPEESYYEDYPQLENGVGMLRLFREDFESELNRIKKEIASTSRREISVATGFAAFDLIDELCKKAESIFPWLTVHVYKIKNNFFGESVTVAGLLTGTDLLDQLKGKPLGSELLYPPAMLKADEEIFLDDMTPATLTERLGVPCLPAGKDGANFLHCLLETTE